MRNLWFVCGVVTTVLFLGCQAESTQSGASNPDPNGQQSATVRLTDQLVEASCGECQFGMKGSSCDLAIRYEGQSYFVDGSSIDDHGDAHADDGMCNCIRQARVTGEIKDGRFIAEKFEVLPKEEPSSSEDQ